MNLDQLIGRLRTDPRLYGLRDRVAHPACHGGPL